MTHQKDIFVSFHLSNGDGGVDVGEIFIYLFAEKEILVREQGASIFAEFHCVKVIAMGIDTVAQFSLEKIVVLAMHIDDGFLAFCRSFLFD